MPVYEVNVYDFVIGELICYDEMGWAPSASGCEITYTYSEDGTSADITVSFPGYNTVTAYSVKNQSGRPGCFDNPAYTVQDIRLLPSR